MDTKAFHPDTYGYTEHEDEDPQGDNIREKSLTVKLRVENTLRWRWTKDRDGQDVRNPIPFQETGIFLTLLISITETRVKLADHPLVRWEPEPPLRQGIIRRNSVHRLIWTNITLDLGWLSVTTVSEHAEHDTKR